MDGKWFSTAFVLFCVSEHHCFLWSVLFVGIQEEIIFKELYEEEREALLPYLALLVFINNVKLQLGWYHVCLFSLLVYVLVCVHTHMVFTEQFCI